MPLPTADIRSNLASWRVLEEEIPSTAARLLGSLECEKYDPDFKGQFIQTTYFDTKDFDFKKARKSNARYCTIRLRSYAPSRCAGGAYEVQAYAISAKTEREKFRKEIDTYTAENILENGMTAALHMLPPNIRARILEIAIKILIPIVTVSFTRYAAENEIDRYTLDINIKTDNGKKYETAVLEYKSTQQKDPIQFPSLRPVKLSKFLWATS